MVKSASLPSSPSAAAIPNRLGDFQLGPPLARRGALPQAYSLAPAVGVSGSAVSGVSALAVCEPMASADPLAFTRIEAAIAARRRLLDPAIAPVLGGGVTGQTAFVIERAGPGSSLADRLSTRGYFTPAQTLQLVRSVGVALIKAHGAGTGHGRLTPAAVWVEDSGAAVLGGFGLGPAEPLNDQRQLAEIVFEALSGRPVPENLLAAPPAAPDLAAWRLDRLRGQVARLSERLAKVLVRALDPDPAQRYPSVAALVREYEIAMEGSIADIVNGAFDAISSGNAGMATMLAGMAAEYAPDSPDLERLRCRLDPNGYGARPTSDAASSSPARFAQPLRSASSVGPSIANPPAPSNSASGGLSPETIRALGLDELLRSTAQSAPRANSWLLFAVGASVLVLLLALVVAATIYRS